MKSVRRFINKNLIMFVIVGIVTVVALGILLMLISGNQEREQVAVNPPAQTAESKQDAESEDIEETTQGSAEDKNDSISQRAQSLFDAKPESISDPAAVAQLLERMELRKNIANYKVTLQTEQEKKGMQITLEKTVTEENKDAFDSEMQKYAELILALIPDADEVQWVYTVKKESGNEEVTVYLDAEQATELLNTDVKKFGESAGTVQALLNQQREQRGH